ncbi:MAG: GGDEF domain-containing protein [Rubrivivax sp.]|nr:GGDEF domain-containing protein [Rubrivivax sp.]
MNAFHDVRQTQARLQSCLAAADPATGGLPAPAAERAREAILLAGALDRPDDQGRAGAWLCTHLFRLGRFGGVLREAPAALPLLAGAALQAERRELLRVLTLSACEAARFDTAIEAAQELVRLTSAGSDGGASLNAAFALAVCLERMGDSWQAVRVLGQALDSHGDAAAEHPRLVALNALCAISLGEFQRLRDAAPAAELHEALARARDAGERARAQLARLHDPAYEVAILGNLGEVLLFQGELDEAERLLDAAHAIARQRGLQAYAWRVRVSVGEWQLAAGRPAEALGGAEALIAEMGGAGESAPQQTLMRAHHVAYLACRALGRFEPALAHFEVVERMERRRATVQLRAQSQLFVTRSEAQRAQWQAEQARQDAERQRERAAAFAASAESDPLTGLGNRRHLDRRCAELLPRLGAEGRSLALALIDIDRFKQINDRHGHAAGDRVLVAMAQLLRENMRETDVLARHGGEEFVIVLPGMGSLLAAEVCERLRERIARHAWAEIVAPGFTLTASIGLASAPPYELPALMQLADQALYRAKRAGRNRLCVAARD